LIERRQLADRKLLHLIDPGQRNTGTLSDRPWKIATLSRSAPTKYWVRVHAYATPKPATTMSISTSSPIIGLRKRC
jgi:hypothetical protein